MLIIKSYDELMRDPRAGDRIKIKDAPGKTSWNVSMNKFLGCVVTVRDFNNYRNFCKIEEDVLEFNGNNSPGWNWYMDAIDGVVMNETEDFLEDPALWLHESMLDALLT